MRDLRSITYGLRDGRNISIGSELFEFAEAMFDPDIMGWHYGYHQSILNTIMKCDKSMLKELFANIVVIGGNTLLQGFVEWLTKEITSFAHQVRTGENVVIDITAPKDRLQCVWKGGSIVAASLSDEKRISMQEYNEMGPSVVHRKCVT